ncbi:lumen HSP seventy [Scheffersomyces coipomensis]|uniref:lumen HSP seventy n=1 Tax=Scheffersomyces coipomensis TaxID=1788519 RepID=UPI00315C7093
MKSSFIIFLISSFLSLVSGAILGLDYGEKFTKAVLLAPGIPFEIVLTDEGKRKDLSGLSIRSTGSSHNQKLERVYGSQTGSLCTRFPQTCLIDIKSLLGKSIDDPLVQEYNNLHPGLKLVPDESRSNSIKFDLGYNNDSYIFTVEEILAMTLNDIRTRAITDLEHNPTAMPIVDDVTISIPAFSSPSTRQAYLDSLYLAGFSNVLGLIDDGSAIAVNYLSNRKFSKEDYTNIKEYHLIYDMGAGSTRATLFSFTPFKNGSIIIELESMGYDETFGGKQLTYSIYNVLVEKFLTLFKLTHQDLTPKIHARIFEASEKAKIILSANNDYYIALESIYDDKDFKTTISREEFEDINADLMDRITNPILSAIQDSSISLENVNSIILHGGSTRVPFVQKHLSTLIGEDKISKSINADESCALGTTLRGLRLKTRFSKNNKEIQLIEKNYHNYEININDSANEIVVFEKGSTIDHPQRVNLGKLVDDTLNIGLYEDDKLFKSYDVTDLLTKGKKLKCKSKQSINVFGTFNINNNKIFDITKLELECVNNVEDAKTTTSNGGFFKNLLNKKDTTTTEVEEEIEEEEEEEVVILNLDNSTNSTNSTTIKKAPRIIRPIIVNLPTAIYPHVKPLSRPAKEKLFAKLAYLNNQDEIAIQLDHVRNLLEGQCYELRNYIESHEESLLEELSSDDIEVHRSTVGDIIEWLEYDSDDASVQDVKDKISEINHIKHSLDLILKIRTTDLSLTGFKSLHEQGSEIIMKIQSLMLDLGSEISEIRHKFDESGFDFNKENERIKNQLLLKGQSKMITFDKDLDTYKDDVTSLGELVELSEREFEKFSKRELFELYEKYSNAVESMTSDVEEIEQSHKSRMKLFTDKFEVLAQRKVQQEIRKKLREQAKESKEPKVKEAKVKQEEEEEEEEPVVEFEEDDDDEEDEQEQEQQQIVENDFEEDYEDSETKEESSAPIDEDLDHDEL